MLDQKDPAKMAYASMAMSFIIFVGIIYLFKPSWVQTTDIRNGKTYISWKLALFSSITFSFVIAIATFIMVSSKREIKESLGYEVSSFSNFSYTYI